jgi:hypothetical protein
MVSATRTSTKKWMNNLSSLHWIYDATVDLTAVLLEYELEPVVGSRVAYRRLSVVYRYVRSVIIFQDLVVDWFHVELLI